MTRGKYSSRAESAKARETAITESTRLRRENEQLRRNMERVQKDSDERHAKDLAAVAAIRQALAEGAEPEVADLKRRVEGYQAELAALRNVLNLEEWLRKAVVGELVNHYIIEHGMTQTQAVQMLSDAALFDRPALEVAPVGVNEKHAARLSPEMRANLKRAKIRQIEEPTFMIRGEIE